MKDMQKCRIQSKNGYCLTRAKLHVREEYLDGQLGADEESHPFLFFHDLQMAREEKKIEILMSI